LARTLILTIKDNGVAEEFARALLGEYSTVSPLIPEGLTLDAMIARPTLFCKCPSHRQKGKIKSHGDWSRAPRYGWFVHAVCRRPAKMVVERFIYNLIGSYNNLLDELRDPGPKNPYMEQHYNVPDLPVRVKETAPEQTVTLPSRSRPGEFHHLELRDGKWSCDCQGFQYQGKCWAIQIQEGLTSS
jgi:hypothetical protein